MSRRVLLVCDWCEQREERIEDDEETAVAEPWFFVAYGPEQSWDFCSADCLKSYDYPV